MSAEHFPFPEDELPEIKRSMELPPAETPIAIKTRRSTSVGKLVEALTKAQLEFTPITKDQKNPYWGNMYADLSNVISATQPSLAKNGLAIIQQATVNMQTQKIIVTSLLVHISDQWIENELELPATMMGKDGKARFDQQSCGAGLTYGRRYAWQGLAGVAAEQDTDGKAEQEADARKQQQDVADRKINEIKMKKKIQEGACLYYSWDEDAQEGTVTGDYELLTLNKELLLFRGAMGRDKRSVVVDAEGLESLKFELGERKIPFKAK